MCGEDLLLQEISTLRAGGAPSHSLTCPPLTPAQVTLILRQGADQLTLLAPHGQLLDLSVGDGVGEDVGQGDGGVVMGTGLALSEPGDQAGEAEPVTAGCLVRISLTQQADWTLKLRREVLQKVVIVSSLVVMSRVHSDD